MMARGARRWVAGAAAATALAAAAMVAVSHRVEVEIARAAALRTAGTTAAYFRVVTPPERRAAPGAGYNVTQLLAQARALTTLPRWTSPVEVYYGTAPLVDATAAPLAAAELARLRAPRLARGGRVALAPLTDPDDRLVVGAVAIAVRRGGVAGLLLRWAVPAGLLAIVAAGAVAARRRPFRDAVIAAGLLGFAAYADVRGAARRGTNEWLTASRLLLQEAATRLPMPRARVRVTDLAGIVRDAELVRADSGTTAPRRVRRRDGVRAVVRVRIGSGRWVELRTFPGEALTAVWLLVLSGIALLGPLGVRGLRWMEDTAARPRERRETAAAWAFLAPAALHVAAFSLVPVLVAAYLSVQAPSGGLAHSAAVLRDPLVWVSLRNTVLYALYVPASMILALLVALVLHGHRRVARVMRTALFLPYASSVVGVALAWQWMYHPDLGIVNGLLAAAGSRVVPWLGHPRTALLTLMLLSVWVHLGYQVTVFLAGLEGIPRAYADAARVDGAGPWRRLRHITLPLLRPVTLFLLLTGVVGAFHFLTYVHVLTAGGPFQATDVVVNRLYQAAWAQRQVGYGSALSLLVFLLLCAVTWSQVRLLRERVDYA